MLLTRHYKMVFARAEIQVDDDGVKWLFSVEKLLVERQPYVVAKSLPPLRMRPDSREILSQSLFLHSRMAGERLTKLSGLMNCYYQRIRAKVKVDNIIGGEYNVTIPKKELPLMVTSPKGINRNKRKADPMNLSRTIQRIGKFKPALPSSLKGAIKIVY